VVSGVMRWKSGVEAQDFCYCCHFCDLCKLVQGWPVGRGWPVGQPALGVP